MIKKFLLIFTIFILTISSSYANYEKYYEFDTNLDVRFIPTNIKLDRESAKEYKKIVKNEKYIAQNRYDKAHKYIPNFIPNIARSINVNVTDKNYPKALEFAKRLVELDTTNLFPKSSKEYRLGILYAQNGDYLNSNTYLIPYFYNNTWAKLQIAQNFYYMQDLKQSEYYALKISKTEGAYIPAQELLYKIYTIYRNPQKAYTVAKNLTIFDSENPQNYINLANVTTNKKEKLNNYYKARNLFKEQNLLDMATKVNDLIAPLEQEKIDIAYKSITSYCKKPDWFKIKEKNKKFINFDNEYWDNRQTNFFSNTNSCLKKFKGKDLVACFNDISNSEENTDIALIEAYAKQKEAEQREIQIRQLVRQNRLLEEQNRIQRYNSFYNYSYYPRYYYRHPYWW